MILGILFRVDGSCILVYRIVGVPQRWGVEALLKTPGSVLTIDESLIFTRFYEKSLAKITLLSKIKNCRYVAHEYHYLRVMKSGKIYYCFLTDFIGKKTISGICNTEELAIIITEN